MESLTDLRDRVYRGDKYEGGWAAVEAIGLAYVRDHHCYIDLTSAARGARQWDARYIDTAQGGAGNGQTGPAGSGFGHGGWCPQNDGVGHGDGGYSSSGGPGTGTGRFSYQRGNGHGTGDGHGWGDSVAREQLLWRI